MSRSKRKRLGPIWRGLASATLAAVFSAGAAQAQLLRPAIDGLVLDPARNLAYAMSEKGGIDAVDLGTGTVAWSTEAAARPLFKLDDVLVAQATSDRSHGLALALLDGTGTSKAQLEVALPERVLVATRDGLGVMFRLYLVSAEGQEVVLGWSALQYPASAVKRRQVSGALSRPAAGAVRLDLARRQLTGIPDAEAERLLANPPGAIEAEIALAAPGPRSFRASDGQGRLVSVLNEDAASPLERYRWTFFDAQGAVAGGVEHAVSSAPFVLLGSTLVFVDQPTGRQVGDVIERVPLSLVAMDLGLNAALWQRELVDTRYHGPFPP